LVNQVNKVYQSGGTVPNTELRLKVDFSEYKGDAIVEVQLDDDQWLPS